VSIDVYDLAVRCAYLRQGQLTFNSKMFKQALKDQEVEEQAQKEIAIITLQRYFRQFKQMREFLDRSHDMAYKEVFKTYLEFNRKGYYLQIVIYKGEPDFLLRFFRSDSMEMVHERKVKSTQMLSITQTNLADDAEVKKLKETYFDE